MWNKTEVAVTATDKSMRKNKETITFTITYDSTMLDAEPPVISYVSGPKSGDRVKVDEGTIVFTISDNSGVDSAWWTLNGAPGDALVNSTNGGGSHGLSYKLTAYGNNTITIHARDASQNKNSGSTEVKIVYNTAPSAITIAAPANNATDVAAEPTFTWNGGTDADGDTMFYVISYGTSENSLTAKTAETKVTSITIAAANKLTANTTYFWKATAYTKTPYADTVESAVSSFKTMGSAPSITTQPAPTSSVNEGGTLTLMVVASGAPSPMSYQWYKDDVKLGGQTTAELNKTNVTASDAGSYHVIVSNGIGNGVSSDKAAVTVKLKARITDHPDMMTVKEGGSATFTVTATGEAPVTYQWYMEGASNTVWTTTTLKIAAVAATDNGKKFFCIVSNAIGKDTSTMALLTVTPTIEYKVSFDLDGGTVTGNAAADQQVKEGGKATKPSIDPVKSGYAFTGWYSSKTATTEFNFTATITGPTVIYAKWKEMCTVSFDGQGATSPPVPTTINVNDAFELGSLPTDPKRTGYFFDAWYTESNGTSSRVTTSMTFSANTTVYAKWIIKDIDNNIYTEVKIGNQVWMVENLKVTKYNDGTAIPNVTDSLEWSDLETGAYCWYNNEILNKSIYGGLYNWHGVNTGKLAPAGWHVPTTNELETLLNYLITNGYNYDGTTDEDKVAKSLASDIRGLWQTSTYEGSPGYQIETNNKSGFTGEPGGYRVVEWYQKGIFTAKGSLAFWWSSTQSTSFDGTYGYALRIESSYTGIHTRWDFNKRNGVSVRCLRD